MGVLQVLSFRHRVRLAASHYSFVVWGLGAPSAYRSDEALLGVGRSCEYESRRDFWPGPCRVSGGGLDDSASPPQLAFALGTLNQANSRAVFHTAARVQVFQFGENIGRSWRGQLLQLQHRRFAYEFGDIVTDAQVGA